MIRYGLRATLVGLVLLMIGRAALAGPEQSAVVFDFELIDMSLQGEINGSDPAEQIRLGLISTQLRKWLSANLDFEVADVAPVAAEARAANLHACGCVAALASKVGAQLAITGVVHKVSNLILSMTIHVVDARTDTPLVMVTADIRSNTDRSWTRAVDWLIKHRLSGALAAL